MNRNSKAPAASSIEALNADFTLDNVSVQWCGAQVLLTLDGKTLTVLDAAAVGLVEKIVRWLAKNSYRCTQIRDGKIYL